MLLQKFRVVILTLSKIKREQKKLFKKAADKPSQTRSGQLRRFNQDAKTYRFDLNVEDRNWEVDETQDVSEPTPYDNLDFTRRGTILPDETADQIDYLIDKVEEAYQTVSNLVDTPKEKGIFTTAERTKKIMKTLVDEMIGDFKFTINNNEKRAIKIN